MTSLKAREVANYFLGIVDEESGDNITNLKLQKLLYYSQGLHVAMNGEPLFADDIEAWELGPVVGSIYREFRDSKAQPIPHPEGFDESDYPPEIREFLSAVARAYGQYSAWKLSEMTHQEPPWRDTFELQKNRRISLEALRDFFSTVVEAGRTSTTVPGEPLWPTESFKFQRRREISKRLAPHREKLRAVARSMSDTDPFSDEED